MRQHSPRRQARPDPPAFFFFQAEDGIRDFCLSRGLIAEHQGELWVASPLKKQRFRLSDGLCMEDEQFSVKHYDARVKDGVVQLRG
ncbi:nitrite reductase (NADH) small subunit [Salmonella enterica]|nr:nitrite reductase (NADH) small subunit [Salmonella enterica]